MKTDGRRDIKSTMNEFIEYVTSESRCWLCKELHIDRNIMPIYNVKFAIKANHWRCPVKFNELLYHGSNSLRLCWLKLTLKLTSHISEFRFCKSWGLLQIIKNVSLKINRFCKRWEKNCAVVWRASTCKGKAFIDMWKRRKTHLLTLNTKHSVFSMSPFFVLDFRAVTIGWLIHNSINRN